MDNKAEQYYPTYVSSQRDILLLEFDEANRIANTQTKIYGQVASVLIATVTIIIPLFFNSEGSEVARSINKNGILFSAIIFVFGALVLRYFVDLQKQITINARKVVTLRILLGLDYGSIHLTLPNWRVEGATNPFAIKYFNGWLSFKSSPFWVLTIGINTIWLLSIQKMEPIALYGDYFFNLKFGCILITVFYLYIFRTNLNDRHETNWLNITKLISKWILWVKLIPDFEYVLYRAKLAYIEMDRLEVDYREMKKILVGIEDRTFYDNNGVSFNSLFRGALSRFKYFRKKHGYIESGGSTITMQLARTLFIITTKNKFRRKATEIFLSYWLSKQFTKEEIIKLHISSVRFERKVLGLSSAIKYFFDVPVKGKKLSREECFFLTERLSNISSTIKWQRVQYLASRVSPALDFQKIKDLYDKQVKLGKLQYSK